MSTDQERQEQSRLLYEEGMAAAEKVDVSLSKKATRGQAWKIAFVVSCFAVGISLLLGSAVARSIVDVKAEQVASEERRKTEEKTTREAIAALQQANEELRGRGQQPIPQPSQMGDSEALVAAATARVLANLPAAPPVPTDEQIGRVLAAYMVTNPVVVSPQRIAQQVANYFAENPVEPEPGEKGDPGDKGERGDKGEKGDPGQKGDPGHTPTPEEIMAVFNEAAARNPSILCAGKGTFTEVVGFVRVPPENLPSERSFWTCLPG